MTFVAMVFASGLGLLLLLLVDIPSKGDWKTLAYFLIITAAGAYAGCLCGVTQATPSTLQMLLSPSTPSLLLRDGVE